MNAMNLPPARFDYSKWRHGGWYVHNVTYASGAIGCVSRNYEDRKWRIACDHRTFDEQPTFASRDAAALAEWHLANADDDGPGDDPCPIHRQPPDRCPPTCDQGAGPAAP